MALNSTYGYDFHFKMYDKIEGDGDVIQFTLPITPPSLKITNDSNNEVVTLINMGEVSVLNTPPLTTFSFTARFPVRNYPYSRYKIHERYMSKEELEDWVNTGNTVGSWLWCYEQFKRVKENKIPFRFVVFRNDNSINNWGTSELVTLEKMEINEDASEGDDVLVDFELRQYRQYSMVKYKDTTPKQPNERKSYKFKYKVKSGDNMTKICKKFGDNVNAFWKRNKKTLDDAVKNNKYANSLGYHDSMGGSLIYAGTWVIVEQKLWDSEAKWYREAIDAQITPEDFDNKGHGYAENNNERVLTAYSAVANEFGTKTMHTVRKGDTLVGISIAYYGSNQYTHEIIKANPKITNPASLKDLAGQTLVIPRKPTITIPDVKG